jgi:5-carboxymethyl-2-hydroxymuconate isomerase
LFGTTRWLLAQSHDLDAVKIAVKLKIGAGHACIRNYRFSSKLFTLIRNFYYKNVSKISLRLAFFFPEGGVGQTQAWMPTYVSILRIPQMI